jgi:hypothetical protein
MTTLIKPTFQRPGLPRRLWLALAFVMTLAACGPAPRSSQSPTAATLSVAPPPAPKTLESTLRLDPGVEEMPFYPQIAESPHGDIVAVWEQFDGEHYNIWGNSSRAHQGWGRASLIHASNTGHSYNPRVAINANGQAMAVWVQMDSAAGSYAIGASRLEPGAGWGAAVQVDAVPGYVPTPVVMATAGVPGQFTVLWEAQEAFPTGVKSSHYRAEQGWRAAGHTCAGQLQALATAGPEEVRRAASAIPAQPVRADMCY